MDWIALPKIEVRRRSPVPAEAFQSELELLLEVQNMMHLRSSSKSPFSKEID